jgi:phosphate-selective porin OprO/OprP
MRPKDYLGSRVLFGVLLSLILPCTLYSQDTTRELPNGTDGLLFTPRVADSTFVNKKTDLAPNEFEGTYSTFRIGFGFIGDFTTYSQDKVFRQQMDSAGLELTPHYQTRDFRVLASGRFLKFKRYLAWKFAYMYDGNDKVWLVRESGLTIGAPELSGTFFIGRTKEGYSTIKVMNGHSGITNERQMALDPIPILADGIKYFGYFPRSRLFLNAGIYDDLFSKGQSFSTFSWQFVGRGGWLPLNDEKSGTLQIAINARYGKPYQDKFSIKSRPESNPTPQLINTGQFDANGSSSLGYEVFFRKDRFMIGSEGMEHNFYSNTSDDHHFFGGDAFVSYFFTNTRRPYNTTGNVFGFVPVSKSVFSGGWGAVEAVLRVSTFNLNNGTIEGGQMTRITPMVNWYLTKAVRWELIYGYGILKRYQLEGRVQFFETRIQLTVM